MITVKTDFNRLYGGDLIRANLKRAVSFVPKAVDKHTKVQLVDDDGSTCWGEVVDLKGQTITVQLWLSTWTDPSPVIPAPRVAFPSESTAYIAAGEQWRLTIVRP